MRKAFLSVLALLCLVSTGLAQTCPVQTGNATALTNLLTTCLPSGEPSILTAQNLRQMLANIISSSFLAPGTLGLIKYGPTTAGVPSQNSGEIYYDNTGLYSEQDSVLNIISDLGASAPPGLIAAAQISSLSQGNNTTFLGGLALKVTAKDRATVNSGNKGVLYGLYSSIQPSINRNNSPVDDATGIIISNDGAGKGSDGLFIGTGSGGVIGSQWANAIAVAGPADTLFLSNGTYTNGINISGATISGNAIASSGFTVTNQGTVVAAGLQSVSYVLTSAPVTLTGTSGTITASNTSIIFNPSGTFTATLPAATSGLWLFIKTIAAQTVNSASSNVQPINSATAGTALLSNTAGKWAILQANGTNWVVMAEGS